MVSSDSRTGISGGLASDCLAARRAVSVKWVQSSRAPEFPSGFWQRGAGTQCVDSGV